jgi:hypothetical protein
MPQARINAWNMPANLGVPQELRGLLSLMALYRRCNILFWAWSFYCKTDQTQIKHDNGEWIARLVKNDFATPLPAIL